MTFACPNCGRLLEIAPELAAGDVQCPACQAVVRPPAPPPAVPPPAVPPPAYAPPAPAAEPPRTPGMAVASLVLGILGVLIGWLCCGLVFPLLAIVFGHIAFARINRRPAEFTGRGLALTGLILGYIGLVFTLIIGVFFGIFTAIMEAAQKSM